jgi:hypothetical protein
MFFSCNLGTLGAAENVNDGRSSNSVGGGVVGERRLLLAEATTTTHNVTASILNRGRHQCTASQTDDIQQARQYLRRRNRFHFKYHL